MWLNVIQAKLKPANAFSSCSWWPHAQGHKCGGIFRGVHVLHYCYILGHFASLSCKFLAFVFPLLPPLCGFFSGKYLGLVSKCRLCRVVTVLRVAMDTCTLSSCAAPPTPWHLPQAHLLAMSLMGNAWTNGTRDEIHLIPCSQGSFNN